MASPWQKCKLLNNYSQTLRNTGSENIDISTDGSTVATTVTPTNTYAITAGTQIWTRSPNDQPITFVVSVDSGTDPEGIYD